MFTFFLPTTSSLLYFNYLIDTQFRVRRSSSHSDNNQLTWRSVSSEFLSTVIDLQVPVNYGKITGYLMPTRWTIIFRVSRVPSLITSMDTEFRVPSWADMEIGDFRVLRVLSSIISIDIEFRVLSSEFRVSGSLWKDKVVT